MDLRAARGRDGTVGTLMTGLITRARLRPGAVAAILARDARRDGGHALVWTLFEGQAHGDRRFLYREEGQGPQDGYLIVSTVPPADPDGLWDLRTKPYEPALAAGDPLRFVLRVNPAVTYKDGETTRRVDVVMKAKAPLDGAARRAVDKDTLVRDWLTPRLAERGADLGAFALTGWQVRTMGQGGRRRNLAVADAEGTLTVSDPAPFTDLLFAGIGKARAYGCGLLLVRRA